MHRLLPRLATLAATSVLVLPVLGASAFAHVTLEAREAKAGAPYKAVLRVPHGCDGAATLSIKAQIPEGLIAVKPMPKAGWRLETTRGAYAKAYAYRHGETLREGVKEIVWTGRLADDRYDEFVFAGFVGKEVPAGKLFIPVTQQCETGEARWIEIPAEGQDAHALKTPAPGLMVLAQAAEHGANVKAGGVMIEMPWIRATPGGAKVAGGYLKIINHGKEADRLIGGSLPAAGRFEIHEMAMDGGVMTMRPLPKGLEIAPGGSVEMKPGGYHLMFMDLAQGLKAGEKIKGTLVFEKAGKVEVEYTVAPVGSGGPGAGGHPHQ